MQKIPLKLAQPGFKLAKAVLREDGITVVAEGVELSDVLIKRLESMSISRVVVKGSPVDLGEAGGGTAFDKRLERLDHLFRAQQGDQWMMKVKGFLGRYFELKAAAQAAEQAALEAEEAAEAEEENGEASEAQPEGA